MSAAGTDSGPWTVARLLQWTREHLQQKGIESARLCAEILLAHAMGCERIRLYTQFDQVPSESVLTPFRDLVRKAAGGVPIAYLIGQKEFFSLPFEVSPAVLIPRPETEILVERVVALVRKERDGTARIVDIGTGSGCIAISLAKHLPQATVAASDVSDAALETARRNAERHGVAERIDFRAGDLFAPWSADDAAAFDVVVSNPPYVATENAPLEPQVREHEPATALFAGADGLDVIRRLVADAPRRLAAGGELLMEIGFDQAEAVRALLTAAGWSNIETYRDHAGIERVFRARRPAVGCAQVA